MPKQNLSWLIAIRLILVALVLIPQAVLFCRRPADAVLQGFITGAA
jgi:hypothetical protein